MFQWLYIHNIYRIYNIYVCRSEQGRCAEVQWPPLLVQLAGQRRQRGQRQVGLVQRQELLQVTV